MWRCVRKAAGKTRMDRTRDGDIRRQVKLQNNWHTIMRSAGRHTSRGWHKQLPD